MGTQKDPATLNTDMKLQTHGQEKSPKQVLVKGDIDEIDMHLKVLFSLGISNTCLNVEDKL